MAPSQRDAAWRAPGGRGEVAAAGAPRQPTLKQHVRLDSGSCSGPTGTVVQEGAQTCEVRWDNGITQWHPHAQLLRDTSALVEVRRRLRAQGI